MSHEPFKISVCGDVTRGYTVAEIDFGDQPVASVFETVDGWHIEFCSTEATSFPLDAFSSAVVAAKERLSCYVNRRGESPPDGLTVAAFSLWLMQKADGTAMGVKL
jgi:hypothetical protein